MAALSVALALLLPPAYRAEIVVSEVRDQGMGGVGGLAGQIGGLASLVNINLGGPGSEALAVLRSRALAEEFVVRNGLLDTLFEDSREEATPWLGALTFRESVLEVQQDTRTQLITVAVKWKDPKLAAAWANDYVALANETMRQRALHSAERNIAFLRKQVAETGIVELQTAFYKLIESETKNLMLANVREQYAFVVVDPAAPPEFRDTPKRTLIVVFGTLLGGVLGVMYAFVADLLRRERLAEL